MVAAVDPGDLPPVHPDANISESMPRVYRAVLDAVERLERGGSRSEAATYRRDAIKVYSRAWDGRNQRQLEEIRDRAVAAADGRERRVSLRVA
jgi:hypothetical protein